MVHYWNSETPSCSGVEVIKSIEALRTRGAAINPHSQGDATEFYTLLIEQCQKETAGTLPPDTDKETEWGRYLASFPSPLTPIFWGTERLSAKFAGCNHATGREEIMGSIVMALPSGVEKVALTTIVAGHYQPHNTETTCRVCGVKRASSHTINTIRPPAILSLWVKRWEETPRGYQRNNVAVEAPLAMTVVVEGVPQHRRLFGALCHQGSMEGGHWTAILIKRDAAFEISDLTIREIKLTDTLVSSDAVALFYY
jgi:ubiquitin C-terminal hydrolase